MLHFTDGLLTITHIAIIAFNLFGWILPSARKAHFICILATAFSWFILGIWFGWGYCPVTDWQWRIKEKLGEANLPSSFITYYADKITGMRFRESVIDIVTLAAFLTAAIVSVYVNFFMKAQRKN
jgi:hypothetical protein